MRTGSTDVPWVVAAALLASASIGGGWFAGSLSREEPVAPASAVEPATAAPRATCWNGTSVVHRVERCPAPLGDAAMFAVLGVQPDQCREDAGSTHTVTSYACRVAGAPVHVARYANADARRERLASYGTCESLAGGRTICGPAVARRWVRTFDEELLFYASVPEDRRGALMTLDQLTVGEIRWGRPI